MNVFAHISAQSDANYDMSGDSAFGAAGANLGNTVSWGGIMDLRDANGNPITDYSATSADTGFNYAKAYAPAVPVPAAAWLFGSSLIGLTGLARNRKTA